MNTLSFEFDSQNCNGWAQLRFLIDNDIYLEHQITSAKERVDLQLDLLPGAHCLQIERYGKRTPENIVFVDGKILQDQMTSLVDIYIDDIRLPDHIKYSGVFAHDDQTVPGGLWWGPNGTWTLNIETPLLDWVINIQRTQHPIGAVFDYQRKAEFHKKLLDFEHALKHGK